MKFNKEFWGAAFDRAVRTVCQTALATLGTCTLITEVNWDVVLYSSAMAGLLSVLTSVATGLPETE